MSFWSESLVLVQRRFPEVAARLAAVRSVPWTPRSAEEGQILGSRWLRGRRIKVGSLLAVSGWDDGSHLRALLSGLPAGCTVFVGEDDPERLRAALEQVDFRDLLSDGRLLLGVGEPDATFFRPLGADHVTGLRSVEPLLYAPSFNRAPERYTRFFTEFARHVDFRRKLEGTRIVDAALWQENTFANLGQLAEAPDIAALAGLFRGRPAVIVSAGPSLDESIEFLRAASRVAVIIAVNSSYRAVRHAGIVPHLVLAADPRVFTLRGFEGVAIDGTWLVTTPIVHPGVPRLFEPRILTWSGANALMTELRRRYGRLPGSILVEQGTISATAIDVAMVLGCERICLVGQDLAVLPDGRSHVKDSFYTDLNANRVEVSACRRLPGNTVPEVLVEEKLYVYLKTFEQMAVHRPQLRFRNVSRLGARIEGMPYVDFEAALRWLGKKPIGDVASLIAKRCAGARVQGMGPAQLRAVLKSTHAYSRDILALALKCAMKCETVPLGSAGEPAPGAASAEALRSAADLDDRLQRDPAEYGVLEGGRTRVELYKARQMELDFEAAPPSTGDLLRARETAWAYAEGAWFLLSQLDRFFAGTGAREEDVKAD